MTLSVQEKNILLQAGKGLTNDQIATKYGVSLSTVKKHLRSANEKLGTKDRFEAYEAMMEKNWRARALTAERLNLSRLRALRMECEDPNEPLARVVQTLDSYLESLGHPWIYEKEETK